MKKLTSLVVVGVLLIGLGLVWNALQAGALPSPDAGAVTPAIQDQPSSQPKPLIVPSVPIKIDHQARISLAGGRLIQLQGQPAATNTPASPLPVQPTNTPAAPEGGIRSTINQAPLSLVVAGMSEPTQPGIVVAEQRVQDESHVQQAVRYAQALRQAGMRFQVINAGVGVTGSASPQSPSAERCKDMLLNPQMDVVEFGDGTGSIEYWSVLYHNTYYDSREGHYQSPSHSLVMVDETDGSDPDLVVIDDTVWDYDEFGQGFQAPGNLTYLKTSYNRLYADANDNDTVWSNLWTLDSQGYLDELVDYWTIGETPDGWSNRYWELSSSQLAEVSGKPLALVFDMLSDMTAPGEVIWLDDAQVRLCYEPGAYTVYLPLIIKQPAPPPGPSCTPYEPDSVDHRGSTTVGATCSGFFSAMDIKDYYSLNLNGVTGVRLGLYNLPSGTNWDAMIYEDTAGYPLACHIGTPGDQDKYANCTLSFSKNCFVLVNAGTAPGGAANTYQMSIVQR